MSELELIENVLSSLVKNLKIANYYLWEAIKASDYLIGKVKNVREKVEK